MSRFSAVFVRALRHTARWRLLVVLWAATAALAALAAAPLQGQLSALLDARPVAQSILDGHDGPLLELAARYAPLLAPSLVLGLAGGAALHLVVGWVAAGAVLAIARGRRGQAVLVETGRAAPLLLRIGLVGLALSLVAALAPGAATIWLGWRAWPRGPRPVLALLVSGGVLTLALHLAVRAVLDYARALATLDGQSTSTLRLVGRAARLAWRRRRVTGLLAAYTLAGWLLPSSVAWWLAALLPASPTAAFVLLAALRQATVLARAWMGAAALAAAAAIVDQAAPPAS